MITEQEISPIQRDIINLMSKTGGLRRHQLCLLLNKPRTTIYDNLSKLAEKDIVKKKVVPLGNGRGRPHTYWILNQEGKN